jgi:crotonobetainyl-CoA:carnitine CoA-transferase CaiB-like acyl-CoA transferase
MAQLEIGTYLLGPAMIDHLNNGREAQPMGNRDGLADRVPNEVYRAADGFVAVTANDDGMWSTIAGIIGLPADWTIERRRAERAVIDHAAARWIAERSAEEAMETLQASGVAAGRVQDADQLFLRDPQHQARTFWLEGDHDVFGRRPHDRFPGLWTHSELAPYRLSPPYLGESNFDVWSDVAGIDVEAVAEGMGTGLFS